MKTNKKKNIALGFSAAFLFLALLGGWPYGFFTLLRFIVFATSAYVAWTAAQEGREGWIWAFGAIAVLFNPFIIIHLKRETWVVIDALVGIFNISAIWLLKFEKNLSVKDGSKGVELN